MTTPTYASPEEVAGKLIKRFGHEMNDAVFKEPIFTQDVDAFIATQRREDLEALKKFILSLPVEHIFRGVGGKIGSRATPYISLEKLTQYLTALLAQDKK